MSATKDRLLRGQEAISPQGYSGTGLKQLAAEAQAPWSSMYHFFPGRKRTARRRGDPLWRQTLCTNDQAMLCPDPREAVAAMFSGEAKILRSSGFRLGCPVASVALDVASTTETVRKPCADVFATWINALAEGIAASGTPRETATDLASYILASLEGAIILSRTSKSVKSLEQTAQFVLRTIQETIRETIEEKLPRRSHKAKGARSGTRT
jgi:TetR/AcrR family transcriptional regulator, lmrAB and yxaGH operons repressor